DGQVFVGTANALVVYGSFVAATTPPAMPTGLAAQSGGIDRINLTWIDNANNEDSFKIERSTDGVNFTQTALANANATSYTDLGLAQGTRYYYRVRASNQIGDSSYSNVASA